MMCKSRRGKCVPVIDQLESRTLLAGTVALLAGAPVTFEGDPANPGQIRVTRTGPLNQALTVNYRVRGGSTAVANVDYQRLSGSVTIKKGNNRAWINVVPIDNTIPRTDMLVSVELLAGDYTIYNSRRIANVNIVDNEPTVQIRKIADVAEDAPSGTTGRFIVERIGASTGPLDVSYSIDPSSTAVSGVDFQPLSGVVRIGAGRSYAWINVVPIDNSAAGQDRTLTLNIVPTTYFSSQTLGSASLAILEDEQVRPGWWNDNWNYRVPVSVNSGSYARTDKPVALDVNFTTALSQLSQSGALIQNSIRIIETTADGQTVLDSNVPFQFDRVVGFNASTNAAGQIVMIMKGNTNANTTRYYHIYFDINGSFTAPSFTSQISFNANSSDEGQSAYRIQNQTATYFYQKENGGFSSIVDNAGNDWLNFNNVAGSGTSGEFRGLPNSVFPGGGFHAGFNNATSQVISSGPLRVVVQTNANILGNTYVMRWSFYPTYAVGEMLQAAGNYWFLYEGTPAGGFNTSTSYVHRSNDVRTSIGTSWTENSGVGTTAGTGNWVYFGDTSADKYLFLTRHNATPTIDSYFPYVDVPNNQSSEAMTVFGFGRNGANASLSGQNTFTIGIADGNAFNAASVLINGAYRDLSTATATAQFRII